MHNVAVQIVRFVDSGFPGWVECELVDAAGRRHILKDKVPIFTVDLELRPDEGCPVSSRNSVTIGGRLVAVKS